MNKTKIQWCDYSWPVINGCRRVSSGCEACYAERLSATRLKHLPKYAGLAEIRHGAPRWTGEVRLWGSELSAPLSLKKPARIFVCDMGDLFYEEVPDDWIDRVFAVMALAAQHTFLVLTKRPGRMRAYFGSGDRWYDREGELTRQQTIAWTAARYFGGEAAGDAASARGWPLSNVHLGVSIEDQQTADERIPLLLQAPAAVRFVSAEPLLGPVDLRGSRILALDDCLRCTDWRGNHLPTCQEPFCDCKAFVPGISWVIAGGESGPAARPCDVTWIRSIVEQCRDAGVPVFVKQLGARPYDSAREPLCAFTSFQHWVNKASSWLGGRSATGVRYARPADAVCIDGRGRVCRNGGDMQRARSDDAFPVHAFEAINLRDRKGGDPMEWPADLRVREFPSIDHERARASA